MKWLNIALLLLCFLGNAQALRIATYNIENYLSTDRVADGTFKKDYPKPESEKESLRKIILAVNPDVLALQEMGNPSLLEELRRDLQTLGLHYPHFAHAQGQDVRHLAILSKIPFTEKAHNAIPINVDKQREFVRRGLLQANFNTNGTPWTLYTVHLKSRYSKDPNDPNSEKIRLAEARAIKQIIASADTPRFLIAGDFNDGPRSKTLKTFLKSDFTSMLPAKDANDEIWTFFSKRQAHYSLIDYFLASPKLLNAIKGNQAHIQSTYGLPHASDHRLVYIDLDL